MKKEQRPYIEVTGFLILIAIFLLSLLFSIQPEGSLATILYFFALGFIIVGILCLIRAFNALKDSAKPLKKVSKISSYSFPILLTFFGILVLVFIPFMVQTFANDFILALGLITMCFLYLLGIPSIQNNLARLLKQSLLMRIPSLFFIGGIFCAIFLFCTLFFIQPAVMILISFGISINGAFLLLRIPSDIPNDFWGENTGFYWLSLFLIFFGAIIFFIVLIVKPEGALTVGIFVISLGLIVLGSIYLLAKTQNTHDVDLRTRTQIFILFLILVLFDTGVLFFVFLFLQPRINTFVLSLGTLIMEAIFILILKIPPEVQTRRSERYRIYVNTAIVIVLLGLVFSFFNFFIIQPTMGIIVTLLGLIKVICLLTKK